MQAKLGKKKETDLQDYYKTIFLEIVLYDVISDFVSHLSVIIDVNDKQYWAINRYQSVVPIYVTFRCRLEALLHQQCYHIM